MGRTGTAVGGDGGAPLSNRPRGVTLLELALSMGVLALLLALLFLVWHIGSRAWQGSDLRADLRNDLGIVVDNLARDVERSVYDSLSIDAEALSFLSAVDYDGVYVLNDLGQPVWQRFVLLYRNGEDNTLRRIDLPLPVPREDAVPIEACDMGGGLLPLSAYLWEGRVLARNVVRFTPSSPVERNVSVRIGLEKEQRDRAPATLEVVTGATFRNQ